MWDVEKEKVTPLSAGFEDYKDTLLQEMEEKIERENAIRQQKLEASAAARAEKMAQLASKAKK